MESGGHLRWSFQQLPRWNPYAHVAELVDALVSGFFGAVLQEIAELARN